MIRDTLVNNYERILKCVKGQKKKAGSKEKEKEVNREFMTFKYSNEGRNDLHEAVILEGKPVFLKYGSSTDRITVVPKIVEAGGKNNRTTT